MDTVYVNRGFTILNGPPVLGGWICIVALVSGTSIWDLGPPFHPPRKLEPKVIIPLFKSWKEEREVEGIGRSTVEREMLYVVYTQY